MTRNRNSQKNFRKNDKLMSISNRVGESEVWTQSDWYQQCVMEAFVVRLSCECRGKEWRHDGRLIVHAAVWLFIVNLSTFLSLTTWDFASSNVIFMNCCYCKSVCLFSMLVFHQLIARLSSFSLADVFGKIPVESSLTRAWNTGGIGKFTFKQYLAISWKE